jgi:hypothetical protein
MTNVLIVSLAAGGGHLAAMFSIERALQEHTPAVSTECFESKLQSLDQIHRSSYTFSDNLYNWLYRAGDLTVVQDVASVVVQPIIQEIADELRPVFESKVYDAVVSTHFFQTHALLKLKKELGLRTKIIA